MSPVEHDCSPVGDPPFQPGLEVSHFNEGLQAAPPNPAGLEMRPAHGLTFSQDDEKTSKTEFSQTAHRPRKYYRISAKTLWIVLVISVLVVIAVGVGAGVGASKKHSTSSTTSPPPNSPTTLNPTTTHPTTIHPTSSTTTTNAASATPDSAGCKNGTIYESSNNTPFIEVCNTNFGTGGAYNTTAADWHALSGMTTFNGCMDACALDRTEGVAFDTAAGTCLSVTWSSGGIYQEICWMKNATAVIGDSNSTAQMTHVVAIADTLSQSAFIQGI